MLGRELPSFTPEDAELRQRVERMFEESDAVVHRILGMIALDAVHQDGLEAA